MEVDRRTLMKGMLASAGLLAMGTPPWSLAEAPSRIPNRYGLLLGGTTADEGFAHGAHAAEVAMVDDALTKTKLKSGLLGGESEMLKLLQTNQGTRWIAVMTDADAVIFLELMRASGAGLRHMGTHACSHDARCGLRHALASTSSAHGVGGMLASQLLQRPGSFSITESFIGESTDQGGWTSWSAPGVSSYRLSVNETVHLHCSGLSLEEGSRYFNLQASEGWLPIPAQVCRHDFLTWRAENWIEMVGYAVTASAVAGHAVRESCSVRAFIHHSHNGKLMPPERFVSFVFDA